MTTKVGISQFKNETPLWAKRTFQIVFILTTSATFVLASEPTISDAVKVQIGVYLKGFDMVIYGISKMFGVDKQESIAEVKIEGK